MKLSDLDDFDRLQNAWDHLENKMDARFNAIEAQIIRLEAQANRLQNLIWIPVAAAIAQTVIAFLK